MDEERLIMEAQNHTIIYTVSHPFCEDNINKDMHGKTLQKQCEWVVTHWDQSNKGITHGRVTNIQNTGEMLAGVFWWTAENRAKAVLHPAYFRGHALTAQGQCEWSAKGSKGSQLAVSSHLCTPGVGKPVPRRPAGPCWVAAPTETGYSESESLLTPGGHHWGDKDTGNPGEVWPLKVGLQGSDEVTYKPKEITIPCVTNYICKIIKFGLYFYV